MTRAIRVHEHGGPEKLRWEEVEVPAPGPGEIRVRQSVLGLNYIDTYHRTGLYPNATPHGLGLEGSGTVEQVGEGVTHLSLGDRIAYGNGPLGAYAEERILPAGRVVKLPDGVSDEQAAAVMLKGMTVRYLIRETYAVKPGETVLWHAAAGGVGLIATQWLSAEGVTVIGTAGSAAKAELAREHGAAHVIRYDEEDVAERVREITDGKGVPVVYDGVGAATLEASLDSLKPRGLLASFGNASGPVTGFALGTLAAKGSLYVTRPVLAAYVPTDEALAANASEVLEQVARGTIKVRVNQRYALQDAADAHRALEARQTTGSTVLTV